MIFAGDLSANDLTKEAFFASAQATNTKGKTCSSKLPRCHTETLPPLYITWKVRPEVFSAMLDRCLPYLLKLDFACAVNMSSNAILTKYITAYKKAKRGRKWIKRTQKISISYGNWRTVGLNDLRPKTLQFRRGILKCLELLPRIASQRSTTTFLHLNTCTSKVKINTCSSRFQQNLYPLTGKWLDQI